MKAQFVGEVKEDVFCNKCGMSCRGYLGNLNGLINARVSGNYDSTHLEDGMTYEFCLCERCLLELINSFTHYAVHGDYLFSKPGSQLWNELFLDKKKKAALNLSEEQLQIFLDSLSKKELISWKDEFINSEGLSEIEKDIFMKIDNILKNKFRTRCAKR